MYFNIYYKDIYGEWRDEKFIAESVEEAREYHTRTKPDGTLWINLTRREYVLYHSKQPMILRSEHDSDHLRPSVKQAVDFLREKYYTVSLDYTDDDHISFYAFECSQYGKPYPLDFCKYYEQFLPFLR